MRINQNARSVRVFRELLNFPADEVKVTPVRFYPVFNSPLDCDQVFKSFHSLTSSIKLLLSQSAFAKLLHFVWRGFPNEAS